MDPGFGDVPLVFEIGLGVFALFFLAVLTVIVVGFTKSRRVLRESGLDPLTARAQIAARVSRGPLGTPAQSLEQRLSEVDDLHRRGLITNAEHDAARAAALEGRR